MLIAVIVLAYLLVGALATLYLQLRDAALGVMSHEPLEDFGWLLLGVALAPAPVWFVVLIICRYLNDPEALRRCNIH